MDEANKMISREALTEILYSEINHVNIEVILQEKDEISLETLKAELEDLLGYEDGLQVYKYAHAYVCQYY